MPLTGRRVLEIADEKGLYCGKLFADMGAEVIKIEPPEGEAARNIPPFWQTAKDSAPGLFFLYTNTGKKSITLDIHSPSGRETFRQLAKTADIIVETLAPGTLNRLGLSFAALRADNPRLVLTSITGFGQTGPYRDFETADIVAQAMGGAMCAIGHAEDPPVVLAGLQAFIMASTEAASSSLMALYHSTLTGEGQHVDISAQEVMLSVTNISGVGKWLEDGIIPKRWGTGLSASVPSGAYPCRDGSVYIMVNRPLHWTALAKWINEVTGNQEILDPMFEGPSTNRQPYVELIDLFFEELTQQFTVDEFYREAQRRHLAVTPLGTPSVISHNRHLREREFFISVRHHNFNAGEQELLYPGAPYRFSKTPWDIRHSAPQRGEHNDELEALLTAHKRQPTPSVEQRSTQGVRPQALAGLRVVEFGAGMAGPWIGRHLAYAGAEVIKVESKHFPDVTRLYISPKQPELGVQSQVSPWFTDWNGGKECVALDLTNPEGAQLARRLILESDIVINNNSNGVLEKFGLGFDELLALKPSLILFSTTGFGNYGPEAHYITWGPNIEALSGISSLSGFAHRECTITQFAYPDPLSALHGLFAILCALDHRQKTGHGQLINLSQLEASIVAVGHLFMEYFANGSEPQKLGNTSLYWAPQNCYPCLGEDRWCVISIADDTQWRRLCEVLEKPHWLDNPQFKDRESRLHHREELDAQIREWTILRDPYEVMHSLQAVGVPVGVVQNAEDQYLRDPHLKARGFFEEIAHHKLGKVTAPGIPLGLTATPGGTTDAGRAVGTDNRRILCTLLGLSADEYQKHIEQGAIET